MLSLTPESLLCAVLRGERPAWPWPEHDAQACEAVLHAAADHGVQALLHANLAGVRWPATVLGPLREAAVQLAMWEMRHQQLLVRTLRALAEVEVYPVLIKGTALAYGRYPDPALRTRSDTDLLVPSSLKDCAASQLSYIGYGRSLGMAGEFASYQANFTIEMPGGGSHTLDLHWKINNSEVLSRVFSYEELRETALPLPALGPDAWATDPVLGLLLACMHRATHKQNPYYVDDHAHHDADRLIWLYDIHLLAGDFDDTRWQRLMHLAAEKGLRSVCAEGLEHAAARFATPCPAAVLAALRRPGPVEGPARYLESRKLRQQWMDFKALGSLSKQWRLLREIALPPASYMRRRYASEARRPLAFLYMRRAVAAIGRALIGAKPAPDRAASAPGSSRAAGGP